ncbi:MAG: hypothetical protein WBC44_01580 [Planctomycetaceae bacterium]
MTTAIATADPFVARDAAQARLAAVQADAEARLIEQYVAAVAGDLRESSSWEAADRFDADPEERPTRPRYGAARGLSLRGIYDRTDGRFLPYYETEWDLQRMRIEGRMLSAFSSVAVGAVETLDRYTIGTGFSFKATVKPRVRDETAANVAAQVQQFIDRFLVVNHVCGELDVETHHYCREDGERFLVVQPESGDVPRIEVLWPEQITEPSHRGKGGLERYLGADDERNHWLFGVHTRDDERGHHDPTRPVGYHVVYNDSGTEWEYYEADQVQHFRRNVPRSAKRGVTDFFPVLEDGDGETRLNRNIREGMAILACIPFVKEYATDKLPAGGVAGANVYTALRPRVGGGTRTVSRQKYVPGMIPELKGASYKPGPLSGMRGDAVTEIAKAVVKRMGTRWSLPSFMMLGDTETALYNAVLTIGSPFVKARESDQAWFGENWVRLIWKAVAVFARQDGFNRVTLEEIERLVEIDWEAPAVAITTDSERATRQETEIRMGILSPQTACEEAGREWGKEKARGAKPEAAAGGVPGQPGQRTVFESMLLENCGTGDGGFKSGNDCGNSGGGVAGGVNGYPFDEPGTAPKKLAGDPKAVVGEEPVVGGPVMRQLSREIARGEYTREELIDDLKSGNVEPQDLLRNGPKASKKLKRWADAKADADGMLSGEDAYDHGNRMLMTWLPSPEALADAAVKAAASRKPAMESVADRLADRIFEGYP